MLLSSPQADTRPTEPHQQGLSRATLNLGGSSDGGQAAQHNPLVEEEWAWGGREAGKAGLGLFVPRPRGRSVVCISHALGEGAEGRVSGLGQAGADVWPQCLAGFGLSGQGSFPVNPHHGPGRGSHLGAREPHPAPRPSLRAGPGRERQLLGFPAGISARRNARRGSYPLAGAGRGGEGRGRSRHRSWLCVPGEGLRLPEVISSELPAPSTLKNIYFY